jgi:protein ImuB
VKTWLGLLCLDLGRRPPAGPVLGFSVVAAPEVPRSVQLTLFGPPAPSPDRVSTTLARLSAALGPGRVGAPEAPDSHRPEAFGVTEWTPAPQEEAATSPPAAPPAGGASALAVRVLRPRVELSVRADAQGRPRWVRAPGLPGGCAIEGEVRVASGPWRLEDGWWADDTMRRDYWDVELSDGALYRIFRDAAHGSWFADGIYD